LENEKTGLAVMGMSYANIALKSKKMAFTLCTRLAKDADKSKPETETILTKATSGHCIFQNKNNRRWQMPVQLQFDGTIFTDAGDVFTAEVGRWIGAKFGIFCTRHVTDK
jgi:hypothetical protein